MRKLALGKLGWRPKEFYEATLAEMVDAMNGYAHRQNKESFYVRRLCYHVVAPHQGENPRIKKESDLWPHPFDDEIEKQRLKNLPRATVSKE